MSSTKAGPAEPVTLTECLEKWGLAETLDFLGTIASMKSLSTAQTQAMQSWWRYQSRFLAATAARVRGYEHK